MWISENFNPLTASSPWHAEVVDAPPKSGVDPLSELRQWSSIIGIVTAIIGNVLISFALNIQRYAHIRIEREYNESSIPPSVAGTKANRKHQGYGTAEQEQIAEERSKLNERSQGLGMAQLETGGNSTNSYERQNEDGQEASPLLKRDGSGSTLATSEEERSTDEEDEEEETQRKSYLRSPYWWAGIILMTIGEAGNFLAYGFAPASIVSPLGVVALISNCIIAPFMLRERFRTRDALGVLVAIAGAVTIVLSAQSSERKFGQGELLGAILRWEFLAYVCITAVAILALSFISARYGDRSILIDLGLVGLFGGYTALSTKGVASLLSDSLWRALTFPITYFLIAVLVISALLQIRYVNRALQRFDSTQVIPTQFVLFTISVIIGSAVLYRDFESATAAQAAKFVGGCFFTFFGVYLITSLRPQETDGNEDLADEEEGIYLIDDERDDQEGSLSRWQTADRASYLPPRTPNRSRSDPSDSGMTSLPQTPYTSTPFGFPSSNQSTRHPSMSDRDPDDSPWFSSSRQTPTSRGPPSPFTRAQSNQAHTSHFARLRSAHSSHPPLHSTLTSPPLYLRSPTEPFTANPQDPTRTQRSGSEAREGFVRQQPAAAEAALRAHLAPWSSSASRNGEPGPAIPSLAPRRPPLTLGARTSMPRLFPGPLLSPLSSSLSAVVAESLRRGEGTGLVVGPGSVGSGSARSKGRHGVVKRQRSGVSHNKRPGVGHASRTSPGPVSISSSWAIRSRSPPTADQEDPRQQQQRPETPTPAQGGHISTRLDPNTLTDRSNSKSAGGPQPQRNPSTDSRDSRLQPMRETSSRLVGRRRRHHHHRRKNHDSRSRSGNSSSTGTGTGSGSNGDAGAGDGDGNSGVGERSSHSLSRSRSNHNNNNNDDGDDGSRTRTRSRDRGAENVDPSASLDVEPENGSRSEPRR